VLINLGVAHVTLFFCDLNTQRGGVGPERLCFWEARLSGLMVKCVLKTEGGQPLFTRQNNTMALASAHSFFYSTIF